MSDETMDRMSLANERAYYQLSTTDRALDWNSAFELTPDNYDGEKAVLMTHGFLGSPYFMRPLAQIYLKAGYKVRAIRLAGHGSSPKALENITLLHWQAQLLKELSTLSNSAKELHLCGFSLGALLGALVEEFHIASHVMIAPPFGISPLSLVAEILYKLGLHNGYALTRKATPSRADNLVMYGEYPLSILHVITQAISLFQKNEARLQDQKIYTLMSLDDGVVSAERILAFFAKNQHPESRLRQYTKRTHALSDTRIVQVDTTQFAPKIEAISHISFTFPPSDSYFGEQGEYYGKLPNDTTFGEPSIRNLFRKDFKRLLYNPDFEALEKDLQQFL